MEKGVDIMKKLVMFLLICGLSILTISVASATVLTFDELSDNQISIPNGYGGFIWNNMYYVNGVSYYYASGYKNGVVSPNNVAYNAYGNPVVVNDGVFDFNGAFFTGAWNDGLNIQIRGYLNGVLIYDSTITVNTSGPTWFAANYMGINELKFDASGG